MIRILQMGKDYAEQAVSYSAVTVGWISDITIAQAVGAVILVARLVVDVPTAYDYIKGRFFTKRHTPTIRRKKNGRKRN